MIPSKNACLLSLVILLLLMARVMISLVFIDLTFYFSNKFGFVSNSTFVNFNVTAGLMGQILRILFTEKKLLWIMCHFFAQNIVEIKNGMSRYVNNLDEVAYVIPSLKD